MKKHENLNSDSIILRRKAEDLLKIMKAKKSTRPEESDMLTLFHELQVYQIELEMQNEELALAKKQAIDLAAEKYSELYDFAPSGYFTLSRDGKILKLNFSGATLLGKERSRLTGNLLSFYISDTTKSVFSHFLSKVFSTDAKESCEITLYRKGKEPVYVNLSGIVTGSGDECLVTATDITSRIQAEELLKQDEAALSQQNELFTQLLKNLDIGVFMVEAPSGKPLLANEKALALLGRNIIPDANKDNLAEVYKAYKADSHQPYPPEEMPVILGINGKSAHVDDLIVVHPDGTEILLEISGTPVKDKNGNVWASLVSFIDITERKKTEETIKLSEEKFRSTFDQSPVGSAIVSMDKKFLRCNPALCYFLSYKEEELIGKSISDVTFPDDIDLGMKEIKQIVGMEFETTTLQKRYLRKDGSIVWGEISISLVRDEKNNPLFFLPIIVDITERKKVEAALKESRELYRDLVELAADGVVIVSNDGFIIDANTCICSMTGQSKDTLIGTHISNSIFTPDSMKQAPFQFDRLNKGEIITSERNILPPDGIEITTETRTKMMPGGTYQTMIHDITERKRSEAVIKIKNDELLKTNAEKDKFFSIIAHDLRSPFNAFLGLTRMMEEELPSLTLEEIKTFATSMRKSANMLFHLLENLLEWSRMQRGLLSFKPETFLLSSEVAASIELVWDAADKKMIEIRQDIPVDLIVKADAQMFESLMRNLIFNAIKFTQKGGKITIAAKKISHKMLELSVSDTGIGMDQHLINKLFRLDEQTNRKGTEGEPSTGLGLIICKDFVEKHGGTIRVESEVGKGSTFYLTIPCENNLAGNSIANNIAPTIETINLIKKLKVLIVEDDEISRMLISTAMIPFSRELLTTRTGSESVEITRNNPDIDLIMMDIQMPEMDGYEATRQIRQFNKEVVILAQTAFGLTSDCEMAMEAGCNDYIAKPLNIALLKGLVQKYFLK